MREGLSIIAAAFGAVLSHPLIALRLMILPAVILAVLEAVYIYDVSTNESEPLIDSFLIRLLDTLLFFMSIAMIAVGWHRYRLLAEAPGGVMARWRPELFGRYAIGWFWLGLVCGLIVFIPAAFLLFMLSALLPFEGTVGMGQPIDMIESLAGTGWASLLLAGIIFCAALTYFYLLFRRGVALVHLAITDEDKGDLSAATWTARLAGPLWVTAFVALLLYGVVFALPFVSATYLYDNPVAETLFPDLPFLPTDIVISAIAVIGSCLIALISAAILTEIYDRVAPDPEDAEDIPPV